MKLSSTPHFDRSYKKLKPEIKVRVDEALRKFIENPRHPGLHFEKLSGGNYRTIRPVRGAFRIVLRGERDEFELIDVDTHKRVDSKYG